MILGYLSLEVTSKELDEEETQFDCFNKSCIWGFGNIRHQN